MNKLQNLKNYLSDLESALIAFSGGVDSAFLLKVAKETLGDNVVAVTAVSNLFPKRELVEAKAFCRKEKIRHIVVKVDELKIPGFADNTPDRCYICKKELFKKIIQKADPRQRHAGITNVIEASNVDDSFDYRPGMKAIRELGVKSPLQIAGLTKLEIRKLSKKLKLKTYSKPSFACLASRFPYGQKITASALNKIDKAEQFLFDMGFKQVRVRCHENLARIETDDKGFKILSVKANREKIFKEFKKLGFVWTAVDILGYRTGSLNEAL